jgi:tRNA (guanine37-N1)-methyltransferase
MRFDILTIFPNFFSGPLDHGILSRAIATGAVSVAAHDLRAFTHDRHRTVDDRPFGGGEGMVLKAQPIFDCVESLGVAAKSERDLTRESVVLLSAQGRPFNQATAHRLAGLERMVLICGRYEGVDERVNDLLADYELSIGDYVLSGGELAAAVVLDATARLLPGVLGHEDSNRSTHGAGGLLDYPHYTRPAEFRGVAIPEVLGGGDHSAIRRWRRQQALAKTLRNRPDLLTGATLTDEDREYLYQLGSRSMP